MRAYIRDLNNIYNRIDNQSMSFFLIELLIHQLHSLHQLVRILFPDPFFQGRKREFLVSLSTLQPLKVMTKHISTVLLLENTIDQMAAE